MNNLKKAGFSLTEVIITIIIVGILALVAIQVHKVLVIRAIASEGKTLMGAIATAEKAYWVENGTFYGYSGPADSQSDPQDHPQTDATKEGAPWGPRSNDPILGVDATGNKYFSKFVLSTGSDYEVFAYSQIEKPFNGIQAILSMNMDQNSTDVNKAKTVIQVKDTGHNLIDEEL